ncbi:MAG TPA: hypothetical protein VEH04_10930 [Verrucomicrobiae bacterium]|nr:hypothetical protein [Verrucomicrobiae bacterium]
MKDIAKKVRRVASIRCLPFLLAILVNMLLLQNVRAALLFHDSFDYVVGEDLGEGSSTGKWANPKSNITIAEGSLSFSGLQAATGNCVSVNGGSSNLDGARTASGSWSNQTSGAVYFSFLLRLNTATGLATSGNGTPILNISHASSASQQLISLNLLNSSGVKIGVLKYPSSSTSVASAFFSSGPGSNLSADGSTTYLVVAKYEWIDGAANDTVTVWVNPTTLGGEEEPANRISASLGGDGGGNAGRLYINRGPNLSIDELRIGQTWADVTPTGAAVPQKQPFITEALVVPEGLLLRGTNGTPLGVYQVLRSSDLVASSTLWASMATNVFDASGNFASTNPAPANGGPHFFRILAGGEFPVAPSISEEPFDRTVLAGQTAAFDVKASGSAPLAYQWYFKNELISGATSASHSIVDAQVDDIGGYHVVITNFVGSVTSIVANLNVVSVPETGVPDGYATLGTGTTGGAGGPTVTVSTFEEFQSYVNNNTGPYTVLVQGTINLGGSNVRVRDNKTIIGLGTDAKLVGDLKVDGNNNVIIRNITFTNPSGAGDSDGLTLQDCRNVWVDHCTFVDCDDGSLDISHGADWITVSWCHFYYTNPSADHRFSNLVGHSDNNAGEDAGKLHVTFHHNWWGQLVHERMPRVRFGRVHVFNNYYNSPGNNNCIRAAIGSEILVENNYFSGVKNVWELYRTSGTDGKVFASGNVQVNTSWAAGDDSSSVQIPGTDILSAEPNGLNPAPYAYALDGADGIPAAVTAGAGAGKGPFAP